MQNFRGRASMRDVLWGSTGDEAYASAIGAGTVQSNRGYSALSAFASGDTLNGGSLPTEIQAWSIPHYTLGGGPLEAQFDGGPGGDTYTGTANADTINGNGGNDTLAGAGGGDTIDGGDGSDSLFSAGITTWSHSYYYINPVVPVLDSGTEVDTLRGGAGYDTLFAGYGDNVDGGADGAALLISFQGASSGVTVNFDGLNNNASLVIGGGTITNITAVQWVDGSNFADTITGGSIGYTSPDIRGLGGDDRLIAGYYGSNLYGGDGNDILDARNSAYGGYYFGEAGDDTIYVGTLPTTRAEGGEGNDTFYGAGNLFGGAGNDTFNLEFTYYSTGAFGDAGADLFNGSQSDETMYGGDGVDVLHGADGNDRLYSAGTVDTQGQIDAIDRGTEHDQLFGDGGNDFLSIGYGDEADGGAGTNTLVLSLIGGSSGVTLNTGGLIASGVTIGGGAVSNIQIVQQIYGSAFADTITMSTQAIMATVDGGGGDDTLTAGSSAVTFYGGAGNDTLIGSSVADSLYGGYGADSVSAGGGDDLIYIQAGDAAPGETVDGGTGNDMVFVYDSNSPNYADLSGITFSNVEQLNANAVKISFAALGSFKTVQAGSILLSTGGNVSLAGITLAIGTGITLSDFATVFDQTGSIPGAQVYTITGGLGDDIITTLGASDTINGGGGDDTINSGAGDDILTGGAGRDIFHAGDGNDRITVSAGDFVAGEVYDGGAGTDTLIFGNTVDISSSTVTSIETLGVSFNGSVSMTGAQLQGFSRLSTPGFSGFVSQTINLTTGGSIAFSGAADVIFFNLAAIDTAFDLAGSTASSRTVNGNTGNDTLTGSQFNDTLNGGGGSDRLDGKAGADQMSGGLGDDIFVLDDAGDRVFENANGGNDIIESSVSITTANAANVETLKLTGNAAIDANGDNLADVLIGNGAANNLNGNAGADILTGGLGADRLTGGSGADIFSDTAAGLNGDTIVDMAIGERIVITDATLAGFSFSLSGSTLTYTGGSLTLQNLPGGAKLVATAGSGGVELALAVINTRRGSDFDGDGKDDLLWRSDSGQFSNWLGKANGGFVGNDGNAFTTVSTSWKIAGVGDFNGDGRSDVLWRSDTGQLSDWLGQANGGFTNNDANAFATVATNWKIAGAGDFNGDGRDDILWRSDSGQVSDWLGKTNGGFANNDANAFTSAPTSWKIAGTGDFNGDGRDDILWRSDSGQLSDWLGKADGGFANNDANAFTGAPTSWHVVGTGDFNGDGRDDILWRSDSGQLSNWLGKADGGFVGNDANAFTTVSTSWRVVSVGDFNGDGRADIAWRSDSGQLSDWLGRADGGFTNNDPNAFVTVPVNWQIQPLDHPLL